MHHVDCSQWNQRDADDERNHENQIHKCKASIKRLRLQEQQKKNVQDQRSVMVQQNVQNERINPYPTAFQYGNGMVLHFYQQQESSTTKTVHKVINRGLKAYV